MKYKATNPVRRCPISLSDKKVIVTQIQVPLSMTNQSSMQNTQYRVRRALKRLLVIVGCITLLAGCEPNTRPQQSQTSAPAPILEPSPTLEANPTPESISASKPKPTPEPLVINLDLTTAQYNDQVTPEAVAQAPAAPTEVSVIVIEADMQETLQPTQDQVQVQASPSPRARPNNSTAYYRRKCGYRRYRTGCQQ